MKNLFADQPKEQRAEMLKGIADVSELQMVRRHYTPEEKEQIKEYLATETVGLLEQKEQFTEVKKEFNKAIAEHNKQIIKSAKDFKRGYSEQNETVYGVADHERDMMDFYDANGEYLTSRRLLPSERQTKMLEMKTGTHND